jgi:hypothetical protein
MEGYTVIKNRIYIDSKMASSMAYNLMLDIQSLSKRDIIENFENETIYYLDSTDVLLTVDIPGGLWDYPVGKVKAIDYHDLIPKSATEEIKSLMTSYRARYYSRSDNSEKIGEILRQVYPGSYPIEIANLYLKQRGVHVVNSVLSVYNGGTFGLFK